MDVEIDVWPLDLITFTITLVVALGGKLQKWPPACSRGCVNADPQQAETSKTGLQPTSWRFELDSKFLSSLKILIFHEMLSRDPSLRWIGQLIKPYQLKTVQKSQQQAATTYVAEQKALFLKQQKAVYK